MCWPLDAVAGWSQSVSSNHDPGLIEQHSVHCAHVHTHCCAQERETQGGSRPFRLLERSVFSDRMVFVRAVHENRWMSDLELGIYDSW